MNPTADPSGGQAHSAADRGSSEPLLLAPAASLIQPPTWRPRTLTARAQQGRSNSQIFLPVCLHTSNCRTDVHQPPDKTHSSRRTPWLKNLLNYLHLLQNLWSHIRVLWHSTVRKIHNVLTFQQSPLHPIVKIEAVRPFLWNDGAYLTTPRHIPEPVTCVFNHWRYNVRACKVIRSN